MSRFLIDLVYGQIWENSGETLWEFSQCKDLNLQETFRGRISVLKICELKFNNSLKTQKDSLRTGFEPVRVTPSDFESDALT